ncbi:MAG TPA: c-type cytochrome [Myxococcota bacterium]|nr:c-type cytochrome [Myxococcota bacterium]
MRAWMFAAALLVACNGGGDDKSTEGDDTDDTTSGDPRVEAILALTADAASGQGLYDEECALCHATDGTGGIGTSFVEELSEHADELDEEKEEWIGTVINGVDGTSMAAYGDTYSDQEIADIMGYIFATFAP